MRRKTELILWTLAILWTAPTVYGQALDSAQEIGVVVEEVEVGHAGQAAGLQPGDEIIAWSATNDHGSTGGWIRSPFELSDIAYTYGPWADLLLSGRHGSRPTTWLIPRAQWLRITARPALPPQVEELYREGKERIAASDLKGGETSWQAAADNLVAEGDSMRASWLLSRWADALSKAKRWTDADAVYERALKVVRSSSKFDLPGTVRILIAWGGSFLDRSSWDQATDRYAQAFDLQRQAVPRSSLEAEILVFLGNSAWYKGELTKAEGFHRQALKTYEELAPESLDMASALNNSANAAIDQGDLDGAEESLRHAEEILRQIQPDALLHGVIFSTLGCVMLSRADLSGAEELFRQALAIYEKWAPDGDEVLRTLNNLGEIAEARGDLVASEDLLLRSLHLAEKIEPDSMGHAEVLGSLGRVARDRGDLDVAERRLRRSLEIAEARVPGSPKLAEMLEIFADLVRLRGHYGEARNALHRALAIQERQAPGSFHLAEAVLQLADVELASGNTQGAEDGFQRARALLESQVPGSPALATAFRGLGDVGARHSEWEAAIGLYRQALKQQEKTGADTAAEAQILHSLGQAETSSGLADEGQRHLCQALDVLDRQRRRLGGTGEARAAFEASNREIYYGCLEALLAQGRSAEAFATLERGRARAFLDLLAERDLEVPGLAPEIAAERRRIDAEYDRLQEKILAQTADRPPGEIEELRGKLRDLRAQQEQITARIRRESPHFASLHYPDPLTLAEARTALDPGTVLLEYVVGPETTWLFAVQSADMPGSGLSIFRIAAGEKALRKAVESLRRLLKRPNSDRAALQARARHLYHLLVFPAEGSIAGARRLLVSPDGPLRTLPFSVLTRGDRYLVEWKPLHSTLSATVYAELKPSRPAHRNLRDERPVAFGFPSYPRSATETVADPEVRETLQRGWNLRPLPSTRKEVESIAALYPQTQLYLGKEATEEKAKSIGPGSRLVHFACHGLLDERFPLNSALALSMPDHPAPGQDNGLLQAWEIFESVRLDADLVTLSACDTALGKEMGGEGLVGLTRAFQYAGARSVLASLWGVADYTTARLMERFYRYLRDGKSKDEALRAAQIDQIRQKSGASHPFFWAAFELNGDWR